VNHLDVHAPYKLQATLLHLLVAQSPINVVDDVQKNGQIKYKKLHRNIFVHIICIYVYDCMCIYIHRIHLLRFELMFSQQHETPKNK